MNIRRLLFETATILLIMSCSVIVINSFQVRQTEATNFKKLQEQYFDTTYQIYKDEIVGNLLLGNQAIEKALFNEIATKRGVGISLINDSQKIKTFSSSPIKTYQIKYGENQHATLYLYPVNDVKKPWILNGLIIPLLLEAFMLGLGFFLLWKRFNKSLLSPLADLVRYLKQGNIESYIPQTSSIHEITNLANTLKVMNTEIQQKALVEAEVTAAKQVGHDIRSPLACLLLALSQASTLPEEQRTLMRSAIQRITDITNCLHSKATQSKNSANEQIESVMISSLLESLISEKRMQTRNLKNIHMDLNLEHAYGLFIEVNAAGLKRLISNIINNSIEAFDEHTHHINIAIHSADDWIEITIQDDGKGIPAEILEKIGNQGFSYGKEHLTNSGTGLGIYHAINTIQSFGGSFSISSELGTGTIVAIRLPRSTVPAWFVEKIKLNNIKKIIILDDDQSIFNLWRERFNRLMTKTELIHFTCGNEFQRFFFNNFRFDYKNLLFLFDYELLNQQKSGLDIIEELGIASNAVLVTSYYEDTQVTKRCNQIGLRIIPKGMAAFIPIS